MEQGFNDDELADIMSEIETLEKEFTGDTEQKADNAGQETESKVTHQVEEQVASMKEEHLESAREQGHDDSNVHHIKNSSEQKSSFAKSAVEFSVHGDMQLNLKFNVSGKEITLTIDENNFDIELEHGMKFNLPLTEKKSA